jgi:hypothetical protein
VVFTRVDALVTHRFRPEASWQQGRPTLKLPLSTASSVRLAQLNGSLRRSFLVVKALYVL